MSITVRLGESVESRLRHLAKITGRTQTYYIKEALIEKLDDLEDIYIAEKRIESSDGRRLSLDDVEQGIGLED
jgi:RHH-type rel operon transcriptional repressor/antitoxin RelB